MTAVFSLLWPASQVRCEAEMQELRAAVEKVVSEVVLGSRSTANTRRALLSTVVDLAGFLGRRWVLDASSAECKR